VSGKIPSGATNGHTYFDDIADDSVMIEDSSMPRQARVAFHQVINMGKAFISQF
jgi:hypothetical protein